MRPALTHAAVLAAASTLLVGCLQLWGALGALSLRGLFGMAALYALLGALLGVLLGGYLQLTQRLPRVLGYLCDVAVGAVVVAWLFDVLGIVAKWHGETQALAELAAFGCLGFGYAVALSLGFARAVLVAPERRPWLRMLLTAFGLAFAAALGKVAGAYSLEQYPTLAHVLHVGQVAFSAHALLVLLAARPPLRVPPRGLWAGVACAAVATISLLSTRADLHVLLGSPTGRPLLGVVRGFTDFDGDGYSGWFGAFDCAPFDAGRHALARDVPADGIDQDCRGGDRIPQKPARAAAALRQGERPSIVLITIDALRVDRLSAYGAARDTTPFLDAWAESAVRFEQHYTAASLTTLSLPALLRGLHLRRLSWTRIYETNGKTVLRAGEPPPADERVKQCLSIPLDDPHPAVNQLLRQAGYHTAAVLDDGDTSYFDERLRAFTGFDHYDYDLEGPVDKRTSDAFLRWLDGAPKDRPFFVWTHYYGPHLPSTNHPGLRNYGTGVVDLYDTEIAHLDAELAPVLARLSELASVRPIAVVITSDHGEEFAHGERSHGLSIAEGVVRVPLFVRAPGLPPGSHRGVTSAVDVMPTVLALAQLEPSMPLDGVDLLGAARGERHVRFESWRLDRDGEPVLDLVGISDGTNKVTLDALLLDETALVLEHGQERDVPFTPRHERLLDELYAALGEDGPPRFSD